jgi:hypothetical protein
MTTELALALMLGIAIAFARTGVDWWRCRTPLGLVNFELIRARRRRQ